MDELRRLLRAVLADDYQSLFPLIELLRYAGDERWLELNYVVGEAAWSMHTGAMTARRDAIEVKQYLRVAFWAELADGEGPLAVLAELGALAAPPEVPDVDDADHEGPPEQVRGVPDTWAERLRRATEEARRTRWQPPPPRPPGQAPRPTPYMRFPPGPTYSDSTDG